MTTVVPGRLVAAVTRRLDRLRELPSGAVDAVITAAVLAATAAPIVVSGHRQWWLLPLAALGSVPLLWRRRAPILVALVVGLATTGLALADQLPPLPFGALVCTYTFSALSPAPLRITAMAVQAAAVVASLVIPGERAASFGYVGMAYATAYALGAGVRARRARIQLLEERAQRLEEERLAAAERERSRMARDIHDIVAHAVTMMVVQAEAGPVVVREHPERAEEAFAVIADSGRQAIGQLRLAVSALRSPQDDPPRQRVPGLPELPALLDDVRQAGLAVTLTETGLPVAVPADVGLAAYRMVQESLTNVLRHADARTVAVRIDWAPPDVTIEVTDDGTGPAHPGATAPSGHGIAGMRERVTGCGGTLTVRPGTRGTGFAVAARFPAR